MNTHYKHSYGLFVLFLILFSACDIVDNITGNGESNDKTTLHPVLVNGKWGYINNSGKVLVEAAFDEARDVSEDMAAVRINAAWGYIEASTASLAISPEYASAGDFSNGLAPVQRQGEPFGYIDKTGSFSVESGFDFAAPFSEGKAAVRTDGLWTYLKTDGSFLFDPKYSNARPFSENLAAVETFDGWIYIDDNGQEVITPSFQISAAREFSEGFAAVQTVEGWGFLNNSGDLEITPKYREAGPFTQNRAWVKGGDYVGFIDKSDQMIIEPQFSEVKSFSENMAAVKLNSDWFFVNRKSNLITLTYPFSEAESFYNGIARVTLGNGEDARHGYIDKQGDYIWFPTK